MIDLPSHSCPSYFQRVEMLIYRTNENQSLILSFNIASVLIRGFWHMRTGSCSQTLWVHADTGKEEHENSLFTSDRQKQTVTHNVTLTDSF